MVPPLGVLHLFLAADAARPSSATSAVPAGEMLNRAYSRGMEMML